VTRRIGATGKRGVADAGDSGRAAKLAVLVDSTLASSARAVGERDNTVMVIPAIVLRIVLVVVVVLLIVV
jgi:hypothetical protein